MNKNDGLDIDWADLIDLFASEYGWTIDYIISLDMGQVVALVKSIKKRYQKQNPKNSYPEIPENIEKGDSEIPMSDFIHKMGGKVIEKDGKKQIIV